MEALSGLSHVYFIEDFSKTWLSQGHVLGAAIGSGETNCTYIPRTESGVRVPESWCPAHGSTSSHDFSMTLPTDIHVQVLRDKQLSSSPAWGNCSAGTQLLVWSWEESNSQNDCWLHELFVISMKLEPSGHTPHWAVWRAFLCLMHSHQRMDPLLPEHETEQCRGLRPPCVSTVRKYVQLTKEDWISSGRGNALLGENHTQKKDRLVPLLLFILL